MDKLKTLQVIVNQYFSELIKLSFGAFSRAGALYLTGGYEGALQIGRRTFQNFLSMATDLPSDGRKGADWYSDTSLAKFGEYVGL